MSKIILILFLLLANISNAQPVEFPKSRPNENQGPTKVFVAFYIIDIEDIDNKRQSFTADVVIRLKWNDPRLSEVKGPVPLNSIWNPNVLIYNLRDAETRLPEIVTKLNDGTVQYTQRYYAKLSSHLNFKDFPFDEQILSISLLAFGFTPNEVQLVYENAGSEEKFSISDWYIEPLGAKTSVMKANLFEDNSEEITRPKLDYNLKANRFIQYYWWKVLAPLLVILFLSWAVFWIDPSQVGAQIGVSGTSILTLIAFLLRLENFLPPVSYLTHMDYFIFTSLVLVFLAYLEALTSTTFALNGKKDFALKLDFTSRIVYPIIYFIVILYFWIL
jgi:hypothetical protein